MLYSYINARRQVVQTKYRQRAIIGCERASQKANAIRVVVEWYGSGQQTIYTCVPTNTGK